jgi:hypothetical protein
VRIENWFFYTDDTGEPTAGVIDFQLMIRTDVTSDLAWFFCTSVSPEFSDAHFADLVDRYFAELNRCGGPLVAAGSEQRALWMECLTLSVCIMVSKLVIGLGGVDPTGGNHVVPQLDYFAHAMIGMWRRLKCAEMWVKFRAGEMAVQKKYPDIGLKLGMKVASIPLPSTPATEAGASSASTPAPALALRAAAAVAASDLAVPQPSMRTISIV